MRLLTPEDSLPVPFASQCNILVPTASRYIVFRPKLAIPFTVLQLNPLVDLSVQKKKQYLLLFSQKKKQTKTTKMKAYQLSLKTGHKHSVNKFLILYS